MNLVQEIQDITLHAMTRIRVYRNMVAEGDPSRSMEFLSEAIEGEEVLTLLYREFRYFFSLTTMDDEEIASKLEMVQMDCQCNLQVHRDFLNLHTSNQFVALSRHNANHRLYERIRKILHGYHLHIEANQIVASLLTT